MGASEIILVFLVYLLFFGAKGIPSLARNMGRAVRQFRDATNDIQREIMDSANDIKREVEREDPSDQTPKKK
jgi:sec-independent protein translocase protein TatA